jgi:electron transfer flavoprotein alpha/beta subunit
VRDSYTPQMLKLQPPFAFLVLGAPCLALIFRSAYWLWLALPFVFTTAPTLRAAMRKRRPAPHWVVWGEWLRAIALTAGVVSGLLAAIPQQPAATSASKVVPQAK